MAKRAGPQREGRGLRGRKELHWVTVCRVEDAHRRERLVGMVVVRASFILELWEVILHVSQPRGGTRFGGVVFGLGSRFLLVPWLAVGAAVTIASGSQRMDGQAAVQAILLSVLTLWLQRGEREWISGYQALHNT